MPCTFSQIEHEAILIARFTDYLTLQDFRAWAAELGRRVAALDAYYVYHLIVITESADSSFTHIMLQFKEGVRKWNVLRTDAVEGHHLQGVIVGTHPLAKLSASFASQEQFGGVNLPIFTTEAEALVYVRQQLANLNRKD